MPISTKARLLGVGLASSVAATSSFPLHRFPLSVAQPSLLMAQAPSAIETSTTPTSTYFKPTFQLTSDAASAIVAACEAEATKNGWAVTIVVADAGGVPLHLHRHAFPASAEIAMGKARTAALFAKETAGLEALANVAEGEARTALLSAPFVLMRGGVPIIIDGQCIGAVGVSGVRADQDEQIARAGVDVVTGELWEAVRDGNMQRAEAALEEGADPNLSLSVTYDASTGQRQWDLFAGAHLTWRHVNVVSFEGSPYKPSITGGVPASRAAIAVEGDTLLHLAVKLRWSALLAVLAVRVELDELRTNADGLCAEAVAWELGSGRVELYRDALVGPYRHGRPQPSPPPPGAPPQTSERHRGSIALMGNNSRKSATHERKGDVWQRLGVEGPSPDLWPHLAKTAKRENSSDGGNHLVNGRKNSVDYDHAAEAAAEAAAWASAEFNANKAAEEAAAVSGLVPVESVLNSDPAAPPTSSAPHLLLLPPPRESPRKSEWLPSTTPPLGVADSFDRAVAVAAPSSPVRSAVDATALPKEPLTPTELPPLSPLHDATSSAAWSAFDESGPRAGAAAPWNGATKGASAPPLSPPDALALHVSEGAALHPTSGAAATSGSRALYEDQSSALIENLQHANAIAGTERVKTSAGITRFAPWNEPPTLGSPLRMARAEFRKGARRLLEADYRRNADEGREVSIVPPKLAPHSEQPMHQLDPCPRPHDETTPPVFPRGMRLPIESAYRSWRAPTLNGFTMQIATPSLPTVDMILSQSHSEVFARFQDQMLSKPRFLLLRPSPCLVTVVAVEEAPHGSLTATPLQQHSSSGTSYNAYEAGTTGASATVTAAGATESITFPTTAAEGEAGSAHAHLMVVYRMDGDKTGRKHRRPAEWFRTNSRPAIG